MGRLKGEYHLISETYLFSWYAKKTYHHRDYGKIREESDQFKIAIDYPLMLHAQFKPKPQVRLIDDWSIPGESSSKAAHYERICEAIKYGLKPNNLFSKIYLFCFPQTRISDFKVEIKSSGGVFIDMNQNYFEDHLQLRACLDFVNETVNRLSMLE